MSGGPRNVAEINRVRLRGQLADNYDGLVKKLTRRLGSSDFAYEALPETFLRLERVTDAVPIQRPPTTYSVLRSTSPGIARKRRSSASAPPRSIHCSTSATTDRARRESSRRDQISMLSSGRWPNCRRGRATYSIA